MIEDKVLYQTSFSVAILQLVDICSGSIKELCSWGRSIWYKGPSDTIWTDLTVAQLEERETVD